MNIAKRIGKVALCVFIMLVALVIIALTVRAAVSGHIRKSNVITKQDGIDEEVALSIGGIDQYLYIRGQNQNNPVIVFLHGGPGAPVTGVLHAYQYSWEKEYTVVNWDQRVSGKTYFLNEDNAEGLASQLSVDLLMEDLHEIVLYLNGRFGQNQVIIVGHSWGSVLGSQFALEYPELVRAFVGAGQTVDVVGGVLKMAEYVRSLAEEEHSNDDITAIDELIERVKNSQVIPNEEALEIYQIAEKYIEVDLNSTVYYKALLTSPYYSLKELTYYGKTEQVTEPLNEYLLTYNLNDYGSEYQVPIIYILGDKDWHNRLTSEEYYDTLNAPYKKYILIEDAGHSVMMDQPETFYTELKEALNSALQSKN